MFNNPSLKKLILRLCAFSASMTCLYGCSSAEDLQSFAGQAGSAIMSWAGDAGSNIVSWGGEVISGAQSWFDEAGKTIVDFFNGPVCEWWNGLVNGATKIYDDVSGAVVDGFNVVTTGVGDCYQAVANGVMTVYGGFVDSFKLKEVDHSTEDYELFKDDNEARVYAIFDQQLGGSYDVFPAFVYHPETNELIDGIGFSSKEDHYVDEKGIGYYGAGFLSGINEIELTEENVAEGIEIIRPDEETDNRYVYNLDVDQFKSHFVAGGRYVRFGVGENRNIFFEEEQTTNYGSEEKYGGLFNYDTGEWIFGNSNNVVLPSGNLIDPDALNALNILGSFGSADNEAGCSFSIDGMITAASNSIHEIKNKIREFKTNIFGAEAVAVEDSLNQVKASDIFAVDGSKFTFQGIPTSIGPFDTDKIAIALAIGGTVLSIILTFVFSIIEKICPALFFLKGVSAAMTGCCMDIFLQMFFEKKSINEVNWLRLIIKSVCSVVSIYTKSMVSDALADAVGETVVAFVTGGESLGNLGAIFAEAFLSSIIVSGIFNVLSKAASKIGHAIKTAKSKKAVKAAGKALTEASSEFASQMDNSTAKAAKCNLNDFADDALPTDQKQLKQYYKKVIRQMPSDKNPNFMKINKSGKEVFKSGGELEGLVMSGQTIDIKPRPGCSDNILDALKREGFNADDVVATFNGRFTVFGKAYGQVEIGENVIGFFKRPKTFTQADIALMNFWSDNPQRVPQRVMEYLTARGKSVGDLTQPMMKQMRKEMRLTWHEVSGQALQLVARDVHQAISHAGGVTFSKILVATGNAQAFLRPILVN